jgi:hypothetical protein
MELQEKIVNEITEFKPFETKMMEFKEKYTGIVYDLFDPEQAARAKADKKAIAKVINALDAEHKDLKAPLKARTDLLDHKRKFIKDELLEIKTGIDDQTNKHEFEKVEHDAKLHNMVLAISSLAEFNEFETPNSDQLAILLESADSIDVDDSYEHRKADATLAKVDAIKKLEMMLDRPIQREEEKVELVRLQEAEAAHLQAEREEKIRKEAAEKATIEANYAAQKRIDDAKAAEQKAIDDAENAKVVSENAAKQAEAKARQQAEQAVEHARERIEREQQIEAQKSADLKKAEDAKKSKQAHRGKIHGQAKADFMANGFDDKQATDLVNLIKDGKIKNVIIEY